jgi:hypothetical protein
MAGLLVNSRGTVILIDPLIAVSERPSTKLGASRSAEWIRTAMPCSAAARAASES